MPMRQLFPPRHLLPLLIFLGVLILGTRVSDVWHILEEGKTFHAVTPLEAATAGALPEVQAPTLGESAQAKPQASAQTGQTTAGQATAGQAAAGPATAASAESTQTTASAETKNDGAGQSSAVLRHSDDSGSVESELIKQLTERRDQLDKRAQALDSKDALIQVAERRVDQKIKEMETLRSQLQAMVDQIGSSQQAQLENLVKIYETMKPKEAAKIFDTLDMPVLLGVVQKMKPARTAAVMAEMSPEKAKEITVSLTKQDQLPSLSKTP